VTANWIEHQPKSPRVPASNITDLSGRKETTPEAAGRAAVSDVLAGGL